MTEQGVKMVSNHDHTFKAFVNAIFEVATCVVSGIVSLLAIFSLLIISVILIGLLMAAQPIHATEPATDHVQSGLAG